MRKMMKRKEGFTLVELLIVVAIIAILTGIAIPNFMGARTKARIGKAFADMDTICTAEQMYELDNEEFTNSTDNLTPGYIKNIPKDSWGEDYRILTNDTGDKFLILSNGPNTNQDVTIDWDSVTSSNVVKGAIGGGAGADSAYGITTQDSDRGKWYHPSGDKNGDIGYGSGQ